MADTVPRIVIAGLSGDSGKTIVSMSLLTALRRKGLAIAVFKKGPDYIDAAWLGNAAGTTCRNLDTFLVKPDDVVGTFFAHAGDSELAVIEGNRGLFDGKDAVGTHSTAELAKLLKAPVVIVVNVTKTTRTVAALIAGCRQFDPDLDIRGVILNRIAGPRHQKVITDAIEQYCGLPVLGAIPKLGDDAALIPGRHLGLVPPAEFGSQSAIDDKLNEIAETYLSVDRLLQIATDTEPLETRHMKTSPPLQPQTTIGYFNDSVFTFYYPENLEALEKAGARLIPISSLSDTSLPDVDGLYIGGGFPETHAERLAANRPLLEAVKRQSEAGLPIYAECGGLIFLARSLTIGEKSYPLAGVFPVDLAMHTRPVGHGYTRLTVDRDNPFYDRGAVITGHEFHYSGPVTAPPDDMTCLQVDMGIGCGGKRDGLVVHKTLATYTHIHACGVTSWAERFTANAIRYRRQCQQRTTDCENDSDSTMVGDMNAGFVRATG